MSEKKVPAKLQTNEVHFLELCADLEMKLAEVYRYFATLFAGNLTYVRLWQKTAAEEESHTQHFRLAVRLKGVGMKGIKTDVSQGVEKIKRAQQFMERLMGAHPSEVEALQVAIQIEENLAALHMSSIVLFEEPELKKTFEAMMRCDEGHIVRLKDFLAALQKTEHPGEADRQQK